MDYNVLKIKDIFALVPLEHTIQKLPQTQLLFVYHVNMGEKFYFINLTFEFNK